MKIVKIEESVKGPKVTLTVSTPISGVRYYCNLNLVGKIAESEITLDRLQKLYKYYM